jgi:hypothetical protein
MRGPKQPTRSAAVMIPPIGILHLPSQDAGRHRTDGKPQSDARQDVDPPS